MINFPIRLLPRTTHPEPGSGKHDIRLSRDEIIGQKIINKKIYNTMEEISLQLFDFGSKWCQKRGLILMDTKYEFGLYNGELMLIDEIHTPDSSRFVTTKTLNKAQTLGIEPEHFDKEFFRLWFVKQGYRGDGTPPQMTVDLISEITKRYIKIYEMITDNNFETFTYPIEERIINTLKKTVI